MTATSDAQLLQARNAGLDFVAQTLHVIGKKSGQLQSSARFCERHAARCACRVGPARQRGHSTGHKALFDCNTAMMAELAARLLTRSVKEILTSV